MGEHHVFRSTYAEAGETAQPVDMHATRSAMRTDRTEFFVSSEKRRKLRKGDVERALDGGLARPARTAASGGLTARGVTVHRRLARSLGRSGPCW